MSRSSLVVALYFALKPASFKRRDALEFSAPSQFIGIVSGFAASVAFAVFYKARARTPASRRMNLGLPAELVPVPEGAGVPEQAAPAETDEEEAREARARPQEAQDQGQEEEEGAGEAPRRRGGRRNGGGEAGGEEERAPAAEAKKNEEPEDGGEGEPLKAG